MSFMIYQHLRYTFLILALMLSPFLLIGQDNYVLLSDASGFDRSEYEVEVSTGADDLIDILSDIESSYSVNYSSGFKVYDFGFYLHNQNMQGLETILNDVEASISSQYYLLFAKETNESGVNANVHVKVKFGNNGCTGYSDSNIESILESVFNEEYDNNPYKFENGVAAVYDKLLCLLPEYWYSCLPSNLTNAKELKSSGEQCEVCEVEILRDYKFLEIPVTLSELPEDPSQNPTLLQTEKKSNSNSIQDRLGVLMTIPGIGEVDLASIINNTSYATSETFITYHCVDFQEALNQWNLSSNMTWAHVEIIDNDSGILYFGSSNDTQTENSELALSHYYDFWTINTNDSEEHFMAASECRFYSDQFYESTLGIDWLGYILELFTGCQNFDPYKDENGNPKGVVPLCFWEDYDGLPILYYSVADMPFSAGLVDGAYNEVTGLLTFVEGSIYFMKALVSYPKCYFLDQIGETEYGEQLYEYLGSYFISYETMEEWLNYFRIESCDQIKVRLKKFSETFDQILKFFKENEFSELMSQAFTAIKNYFSSLAGVGNVERYKQGKLVFGVASFFIPAGAGVKVLDKLSDTVSKVTSKIDNLLAGKGSKAGGHLSDDLIKGLDYAKASPDPTLIVKLEDEIRNGSEEFLEFLGENGESGVKAWEKLIDIPNIRVSVKSLETVSKWVDDGIELTFEAIQDGAKIVNKNGDEVGKLIKNGSDEFLEISDDLFVEVGTAKSFGTVTVKGNTGESFINPGYVKNADGTIGFVEDVASYGTAVVQSTIKKRGKLRGTLTGIVKGEDAHHIFPVQTLKENQWVKKGVEGGFEFNTPVNGIAVEKFVKATGQGRHGPHPKLTKQMSDHMDWWADQTSMVNGVSIKNKDLTPTQTADYMRAVSDDVKDIISDPINATTKLNDLDLGLDHF